MKNNKFILINQTKNKNQKNNCHNNNKNNKIMIIIMENMTMKNQAKNMNKLWTLNRIITIKIRVKRINQKKYKKIKVTIFYTQKSLIN